MRRALCHVLALPTTLCARATLHGCDGAPPLITHASASACSQGTMQACGPTLPPPPPPPSSPCSGRHTLHHLKARTCRTAWKGLGPLLHKEDMLSIEPAWYLWELQCFQILRIMLYACVHVDVARPQGHVRIKHL